MKNRNLIKSFNNALNGFVYALKTERNLRIHVMAALTVLFVSLFMKITSIEVLILLSTITLVMITEMINTAVENLVDIATDNYHPLAKIAKDVASGAVFITTVNALIVAYIIFFDKLNFAMQTVITKVQQTPTHIAFIAVCIVVLTVFILKAYFNKNANFQGGMPSGHAALAFSTATAISFISKDISVTTLCVILAFLVAQSRIEGDIHTPFEVLTGGVVGIAITILIFKLVA